MRVLRGKYNVLNISALCEMLLGMSLFDAWKRLFRAAEKHVWACGKACSDTRNGLFRVMTLRLEGARHD